MDKVNGAELLDDLVSRNQLKFAFSNDMTIQVYYMGVAPGPNGPAMAETLVIPLLPPCLGCRFVDIVL